MGIGAAGQWVPIITGHFIGEWDLIPLFIFGFGFGLFLNGLRDMRAQHRAMRSRVPIHLDAEGQRRMNAVIEAELRRQGQWPPERPPLNGA